MWRTRAEQLLARPGLIGATGATRVAVLELRTEAMAALDEADARLRAATEDRLAAVDRVRRANRALVGSGQVIDPETGAVIQYLRRRSDAVVDPLPPREPLDPIEPGDLRDLLVDLLRVVDRPMKVAELVRLVAIHGFVPAGRPSRAVSNAMRVEMDAGQVCRVRRGWYAAI
jgi:hypothetical protein